MAYAHSFSFAGSGWMMVYEFGVARVLQQYNLPHKSRFIGTSAGALAATGLAIGADFDAVVRTIISDHVPLAYASAQGPFRLREYLKEGFSKHGNLHKFTQLNAEPGKVTIVYTSLSALTSRRKTCGFQSADHLMQTLLASCCAPPLAGWPFQLDGEWILDGGVLDNQPLFEDGWWTAFPSSQDDTQWVYELGQADAIRWLVSQGLAPASELVKVDRVQSLEWKTTTGTHVGYRALDAELDQVALTLLAVASCFAAAFVKQIHTHTAHVVRHGGSTAYAVGLGTTLIVTLFCVY